MSDARERKKVLISGGTGLVGSVLVPRLLAKGYQVLVISRRKERIPRDAVPIVADISDRGWIAKCTDVVKDVDHLIWMAYSIAGDPEKDGRATFSGLVEAVHALQVRDVIFLGSTGVYGQNPAAGLYSEGSKKVADTNYAKDKISAVEFLRDQSARFRATVLHPSCIYSADSRRVEYYRKLLASVYLVYRNDGSGTYNIVHTEDVVDAILGAMSRETGAAFEEYIVNGETLRFRDWIRHIEQWCGYEDKKMLPPYLQPVCRGPVRQILSRWGYRSPAKMPALKASLFEKEIVFSTEKIKNHLGWYPKKKLAESLP
jgi:nucleoside-diphosphate-sugar epimerase